MDFRKQCKTCEFNFSGICAGHGSTYKYGEQITDDTKGCEGWGASLEYFTYAMTNAPRFLREQLNECRISYDQFSSRLDDYNGGKGIPVDIFDAVKSVYGISMIDIAVLLGVSFGVVYHAKTKGIPLKRIRQFADILCITPTLLTSVTTQDFDKLREAKNMFFSQPAIESRINAMPEWKSELADIISSVYLNCPVNIAKDVSRVDKVYWTTDMRTDDFTESERVLIKYIARSSKSYQSAFGIEYALDLACKPHLRIMSRQD